MGYVIAGTGAVGLLAIIGLAAREDDRSQSAFRNVASQMLIVALVVAGIGAVVWVATYGN